MSVSVHPLAGQRVGYARVSSAAQNLDGQTDALHAAGCEKIFADTASGKLAERPELSLCLGVVPSRSSMSGDLGIFVDQPAESIATSEVQVGL